MSPKNLRDLYDALPLLIAEANQIPGMQELPDLQLSVTSLLVSGVATAAVAGLAKLLRSKQELTKRAVTSAILWSGVLGLITALFGAGTEGANPYMVLASCGLVGLGVVTVIDAVELMKKSGGFSFQIKPSNPDMDALDHDTHKNQEDI